MYNRHVAPDQAVSVEPALVEELLDQVRTGNVIVGRDGGASEAVAAKGRSDIESPYLQLVLTRLWGRGTPTRLENPAQAHPGRARRGADHRPLPP